MVISPAIRHNLHPWRSRKNLSKNAFRKSNSRSSISETYALVLCRSNTMSAAVPIAGAKPLPRSNTARIIRLVLRAMAEAPASLFVRTTYPKFNSSWKTIVNFENLSTSGSPCRLSYPACGFAKNVERRETKRKGRTREFPSTNAARASESNRQFMRRTLANKGADEFRDRN